MMAQVILFNPQKQKIETHLSSFCLVSQQLEVVPLYGDMQIAPYRYIQNGTNFDPSKWPCCESNQPSPQSDLLMNLEAVREDHMTYISQLARHTNEVSSPLFHF